MLVVVVCAVLLAIMKFRLSNSFFHFFSGRFSIKEYLNMQYLYFIRDMESSNFVKWFDGKTLKTRGKIVSFNW